MFCKMRNIYIWYVLKKEIQKATLLSDMSCSKLYCFSIQPSKKISLFPFSFLVNFTYKHGSVGIK